MAKAKTGSDTKARGPTGERTTPLRAAVNRAADKKSGAKGGGGGKGKGHSGGN